MWTFGELTKGFRELINRVGELAACELTRHVRQSERVPKKVILLPAHSLTPKSFSLNFIAKSHFCYGIFFLFSYVNNYCLNQSLKITDQRFMVWVSVYPNRAWERMTEEICFFFPIAVFNFVLVYHTFSGWFKHISDRKRKKKTNSCCDQKHLTISNTFS